MNPGMGELVKRAIKYLVEGLMVAIAAYVFPKKKMNPDEIIMIALVASATFAIMSGNEVLGDEGDLLGAFYNGELRGIASPTISIAFCKDAL